MKKGRLASDEKGERIVLAEEVSWIAILCCLACNVHGVVCQSLAYEHTHIYIY
jgi:hypothetical protein